MIVPQQTNRLAESKSPYLQQHARNPVDWYPWGAEAFEKARVGQKPIFLSVGYSTCHWCHVMERESFENAEIAGYLNAHFVSIKVDREERPDVDRLYMLYIQAATGSGGWPMTVFLTPDRLPFSGGTYFPPEDRWGRPGLMTVLKSIAQLWKDDRERLEQAGQRVLEALSARTEPDQAAAEIPEWTRRCYGQLAGSFDGEEGGFGRAPKFPRPTVMQFLLRFAERENSRHALEMTTATLDAMAAGGIHDQIGGGFHRYSVDRRWHVPHFEKMLYDQAQLVMAYCEAYQITQRPDYARVVQRTLRYVSRDLGSPGGAFFSAEDADSPAPEGDHQAEGAFYLWKAGEIDSLLGETRGAFARRCFGVEPDGNVPAEGDPHGEFAGWNILTRRIPLASVATLSVVPDTDAERHIEEVIRDLFAARSQRPRPHRDEKVITSWNGLMISAFARAGAALGDLDLIARADEAARFFKHHPAIHRCFREGPSGAPAAAEDYAFLIQGLIDLYETGAGEGLLRWAVALQEQQNALFWDRTGGYFSSAEGDPSMILRVKEEHDSAEPAAGSVSIANLIRLSRMSRRPEWLERARQVGRSFAPVFERFPSALPCALAALDLIDRPARQIIVAGGRDAPGRWDLVREIHRTYLPDRLVLFADGGADASWLAGPIPELESMRTGAKGEAMAYVCSDFTCREPTSDPRALREMLGQTGHPSAVTGASPAAV